MSRSVPIFRSLSDYLRNRLRSHLPTVDSWIQVVTWPWLFGDLGSTTVEFKMVDRLILQLNVFLLMKERMWWFSHLILNLVNIFMSVKKTTQSISFPWLPLFSSLLTRKKESSLSNAVRIHEYRPYTKSPFRFLWSLVFIIYRTLRVPTSSLVEVILTFCIDSWSCLDQLNPNHRFYTSLHIDYRR